MVTAADVAETEGRMLPSWLADSLSVVVESRNISEPARSELREARLDAVQLVCGVAALTGQPPAKAIERELGVAPRTAAHWIRLARTAGRLDVLTRIVVDVGEASGVELELSSSTARTHGGFSCPTVMPG
jgi:hypothetical protein